MFAREGVLQIAGGDVKQEDVATIVRCNTIGAIGRKRGRLHPPLVMPIETSFEAAGIEIPDLDGAVAA